MTGSGWDRALVCAFLMYQPNGVEVASSYEWAYSSEAHWYLQLELRAHLKELQNLMRAPYAQHVYCL